MNRADRRKEERAQRHAIAEIPAWKMAEIKKRVDAAARLMQNGITQQDLQDAYERGRKDGIKEHVDSILPYQVRFFYSAAAIAAHDLHGFGEKRCMALLDRIQEIMTEEICTGDIIARCKRETGVDVFEEEYTI